MNSLLDKLPWSGGAAEKCAGELEQLLKRDFRPTQMSFGSLWAEHTHKLIDELSSKDGGESEREPHWFRAGL